MRRLTRTARRVALPAVVLACLACEPAGEAELVPRSTLFLGIDVSESFQRDGRYDDAVAFAARYIHGRLTGAGELDEPRALFVGAIGGERPGQPQAFHPIHDFEGKTPAEIEADLRAWFRPHDQYTDFNAFFQRAATLVKRQNLVLAPVTLVLLTDGVPDVGAPRSAAPDEAERYARVDLDPLEYLARNVTVRVLYPDPPVAVHWERTVPRDRVRMWTVDAVVMRGWREQLREPEPATRLAVRGAEETLAGADTAAGAPGPDSTAMAAAADTGEIGTGELDTMRVARGDDADRPPVALAPQPELWRWIQDNVDFRVRRTVF